MSNEVTKKQFAEILGVRPSYVTKLAKADRLVMTPDGKRVRVEESKALIEATRGNRDDVADRHAQERGREAAGGGSGQAPSGLEQARKVKAISEARRMSAAADREEMERDRLAGALLDRADVEFVMQDFGARLRGLMENFADRWAPQLFPLDNLEETHAALSEAAEDVLTEMAEAMRRREKELGGSDER